MMMLLPKLAESLLAAARGAQSLLYPYNCMVCRRPLAEGAILCAACDEALPRLVPPYCAVCSQPFDGAISGEFTCDTCHDRQFAFVSAISSRRNTGLARRLIHRYKYQREFHLRRIIGDWLGECLDDRRLLPFDLIVPVPLHPARLREREFDQALALAELFAAACGRPLAQCLKRVRRTTSQTQFQRSRRIANLRGAFRARRDGRLDAASVLLVDDVFTTGSTVDECARELLRAGAARVQVATAARS